jgi:uncharacterized membrane protein YfbV (UPF0208 family)
LIYLTLLGRATLGLIFGWAGLAKLVDLTSLERSLTEYRLLPTSVTPYASRLLPAVELFVALILLSSVFYATPGVQPTVLVALLLLLLFSIGIAVNLVRGRNNISCGCFGAHTNNISWRLVIRNIVLMGAAGWPAMQSLARTPPHQVDTLSASLTALSIVLSYFLLLHVRQLHSLHNPPPLQVDRAQSYNSHE